MKRKLITILLAFCLILSPVCNAFVSAQALDEPFTNEEMAPSGNIIQPKTLYISTALTSLSIISDNAICLASLSCYPSVTTKIKITMVLQKKFLFFWLNQETWTQTFYSYKGNLLREIGVNGGTYRVKATYVAYSGTASESITGYSSDVSN